MQLNVWWTTHFYCTEFNVTMDIAFVMYTKGLQQFKDIRKMAQQDFKQQGLVLSH